MSMDQGPATPREREVRQLAMALRQRAPSDAFHLLEGKSEALIAAALSLLERYDEPHRATLYAFDPRLEQSTAEDVAAQPHGEDRIGVLATPAKAVFHTGASVAEVILKVRELSLSHELVTYAYVVDAENRLKGLLTMRDLLLASPSTCVAEVMLAEPFALKPQMTVEEAMRETARRHYPLYPMRDDEGRLLGTVAGAALFEAYADDGRCITMGNTLISGSYGRAQIKDYAAGILQVFPQGIRFTITGITAEGERVEAESDGLHVSGRRYANQYHFLFRFREGRIVEFKEYMDTEQVTEVLCGGQKRPA